MFAALLMGRLSAQESEIFAPQGIAIGGYDAVAFFTQSRPVKGTEEFSLQYKNAKWLFASKENLNEFTKSPKKYAPQYGGYCAYGTAQGHKASTEAETWTILNGKLYFNYNQQVKKTWSKDMQHFIEIADQNWPAVKQSK
jgi:YHS domain-containing protein